MTEVDSPLPTTSAFPRPTSLFLPERFTSSIIDSSSYTPFPSFPGSAHARDPFGLNAFLLPPDDRTLEYVDPAPAMFSSSSGSIKQPNAEQASSPLDPASPAEVQDPNRLRFPSIRKQRSIIGFRPSPLGQSPVGPEPSGRTRSNSLDSAGSLSPKLAELSLAPVPLEDCAPVSELEPPKSAGASSIGRRSFRKVLFRASKSVFNSDTYSPPVPALPDATTIATARPGSERSSEDSQRLTPPLSRSDSTHSPNSSASSISSSEGVRTPAEGSQLERAVPSVKLAVALSLAEAGDRRKGWRSWLGGRKGSKASTGMLTPDSNSAGLSPNASVVDLLETKKVPLTPPVASPSPLSSVTHMRDGEFEDPLLVPSAPTTPPSRVASLPSSPPTHSWIGESLRRASLRKVGALRRPSPHPLALHLRRQHCPLPDEVAFSLQAGQKVFPKSVNAPSTSLAPAQGGLWTSLAVKIVLSHLDAGLLPSGILSSRRDSQESSGSTQPRGISDFVQRPPFEDRMLVYFPDGSYSPVSTARPGFAVWDLDFSAYVLGLGELDGPTNGFGQAEAEATATAGRSLPRSSFTGVREEVGEVLSGQLAESHESDAKKEVEAQASSAASSSFRRAPARDGKSVIPAIAVEDVVISSFRNAKPREYTWDYSSEEEEEEEDAEDERPLASLTARPSSLREGSYTTSQVARPASSPPRLPRTSSSPPRLPRVSPAIKSSPPRLPKAASTSTVNLARLRMPTAGHVRTLSQPESRKVAAGWDERQDRSAREVDWDQRQQREQKLAREEVAKARRRRERNLAGDAERRAQAEAAGRLRSAMKGARKASEQNLPTMRSAEGRTEAEKRGSTTSLPPSVREPRPSLSGAGPLVAEEDRRRRVRSSVDGRASMRDRSTSQPASASVAAHRRSHSVYDTSRSSSGSGAASPVSFVRAPVFHQPVYPAYPYPVQVAGSPMFVHPEMMAVGVPFSASIPQYAVPSNAHSSTMYASHPSIPSMQVPMPTAMPTSCRTSMVFPQMYYQGQGYPLHPHSQPQQLSHSPSNVRPHPQHPPHPRPHSHSYSAPALPSASGSHSHRHSSSSSTPAPGSGSRTSLVVPQGTQQRRSSPLSRG